MESFQFKFNRDGSTEDLSDVSSAGYRKYQDTKLKWSINMHPDWVENKDNKIENAVSFTSKNNSILQVKVYSLEKGETLDSITKESINEGNEDLNPTLYTVLKQESSVIGGAKCNKVFYTLKILNKTTYGCDIFFTDKNYKYVLCYELSEEDYNNFKLKKMVDGMISSFSFKELNPKTIGKLLDPDKVVLAKKSRSISDDLYQMNIPFNWVTSDDNTDNFKEYYKGSSSVTVSVYDGNSLYDFINYLDEYYQKKVGKDFRIESKTTITEKNTTCYKYVFIYESDGCEYRKELYVIQKGTKVISVYFDINNLLYGTKNINTFSEIWNSFTLK